MNRWPNITYKTNVCGGCAIVVNSRLPVWVVADAMKAGQTDTEMIEAWPRLTCELLGEIRSFYFSHRAEIDSDIRKNR